MFLFFFLTSSTNPPQLANIVSANVFGKDRGCLWDGQGGREGESVWGGGGGKEGFSEGGEMKTDGIRRWGKKLMYQKKWNEQTML